MDLNVYCIDKCYVTTIKDYLDQIFVLSQIGPPEYTLKNAYIINFKSKKGLYNPSSQYTCARYFHGFYRQHFPKFPDFSLIKIRFPRPNEYKM